MSDHVIVWDLETVPDIAGYAAANGLTGKSDEEIREALGNKFPKHIYHSMVCIGALVAHKERDALGAPYVGERPEKEPSTKLHRVLAAHRRRARIIAQLHEQAIAAAHNAPWLRARPLAVMAAPRA